MENTDNDLLTALTFIDPSALTYGEWLAVGMDLYANGYDVSAWDNWSQSDPRYKNGVCSVKWRSFGSDVSGGTIMGMAVKNGYKPTRNKPIKPTFRPRPVNPIDAIEPFTDNAEKWTLDDVIIKAHKQLLECTEKAVKTTYDGKIYNITPLTYLTRVRKISLDIINRKMIGYAPNGHNDILVNYPDYQIKDGKVNQSHKIIFPFSNGDGGFNYFMTETVNRDIMVYSGNDPNGKPTYNPIQKYLKPKSDNGKPGQPATVPTIKAELYNEYLLKGSDVPPIIFIVEGIYDALSIETVGGNAIVLTGTAHKRFISICKTFRPQTLFVISLDNDGAGNKAIDRVTEGLTMLGMKYITRQAPEPYKDFNECLQNDRETLEKFVTEVSGTTEKDQLYEQFIKALTTEPKPTKAFEKLSYRIENQKYRKRPK